MTNKKLIEGMALNSVGNVIVQILFLLVSIIIARSLGPEKLGIYYLLINIPAILNTFTTLGHNQGLNRFIPELKGKSKSEFINPLMKKVFITRAIFSFISVLLLFVFSDFIAKTFGLGDAINNLNIILLSCYFILSTFNALLILLLTIRYEQKKINMINIIAAFADLLIVLVLLSFNLVTVRNLLIVILVLEMFKFIFCFVSLRSKRDKIKYSKDEFKPLFKRFSRYSYVMFGVQIAGFVLAYRSDIYFIGFYLTPTFVAYYLLASNLVTKAYGLISTRNTGQLMLASLMERFGKHGKTKLLIFFQYLAEFTVLYSLPIMLLGIIVSRDFITTMYGVEYLAVVPLLMAFFIINFIIILGTVFSVIIVAYEKPHYFLWTKILSVINIVLNMALIPAIGIMGAVISTSLTQILILMVEVWLANKLVKIKLRLRNIFKIILANLFMGVVIYLLQSLLPEGLIRLLVTVFVGMFIYLYLIFRWNAIDREIICYLPKPFKRIVIFFQYISAHR